MARGLPNSEITGALAISIRTVKAHIGSLLVKLHARDQLVIGAYEAGLVTPV